MKERPQGALASATPVALLGLLFAMGACAGDRVEPGGERMTRSPGVAPNERPSGEIETEFDRVDADLLAAPPSAFVDVRPDEVGVTPAPDITQAIAPLVAAGEGEAGEPVRVSVRIGDFNANVDVVRTGIRDDSVAGEHTRVQFSYTSDDRAWHPIGAQRRLMCARGPNRLQWTKEPCP
jgi:hypothetical protein